MKTWAWGSDLVSGIPNEDRPTKVPMLVDSFFDAAQIASAPSCPDLSKECVFADRQVSDLGCLLFCVVRGEVLLCRPADGLRAPNADKEEHLGGLVDDQD